jgi:thiamine pyrophosphokinase
VFPTPDLCHNSNSIPMNPMIVQSTRAVTLVGGGSLPARDLALALKRAPLAVGADSGADRLMAAGVLPDAVIGDFDSISPKTRAALPPDRLHPAPDQDRSDFDKALQAIDAPLILAVGFTGARMDHALAVMNALIRLPHRRCIVIGPKDIAFAAPPHLDLNLRPGDTVSLFPLAQVAATSTGLHWPLDGLDFTPWGMIGTSNRASSARVQMSFDCPGMLAILPRARLDRAITALLAAPDWPAEDAPAARDR